jgi:hypothetical protein
MQLIIIVVLLVTLIGSSESYRNENAMLRHAVSTRDYRCKPELPPQVTPLLKAHRSVIM